MSYTEVGSQGRYCAEWDNEVVQNVCLYRNEYTAAGLHATTVTNTFLFPIGLVHNMIATSN